jgi:hypothetical protein
MPVEYAFDGTLPNVVFDADILNGAVDKFVKELFGVYHPSFWVVVGLSSHSWHWYRFGLMTIYVL